MHDFDLLIVGSGPAGQHAALHAAQMGKRVGIIERKSRIGGAGLQTGTIPSKALREVAYMASQSGQRGMREAFPAEAHHRHGLLAEAIRRKEAVIAQQESVILNQLMRHGVALIPGGASFKDERTLLIQGPGGDEQLLTAGIIILATGSRPRRPSHIPFDKQTVLDSTSVLKIRHLPHSMIVVGGGVIACEFISMFAALGVRITVIDSHEQILSWLSEDVASALTDAMQAMGVSFVMQQNCQSVCREDNGVKARLEDGSELKADALLYAQGREPNTQYLDVGKAGIKTDGQWLPVNEYFQTSQPHIYAVGDLIGKPALAATAMEQGRMAAMHAFGQDPPALARNMPMAIYTIPELSSVGATEGELKEQGIDYVVGRGYFRESARGQIIGDMTGLLKLNVDRASRRILGVHIVGESASELIHIGQLLMNLDGSVDDLVSNVFNYPTLAECYKMAATDCLNHLTPAG